MSKADKTDRGADITAHVTSNPREAIFAQIRTELGVNGDPGDARRAAVRARLASHPANLIPERASRPRAQLAAQMRGYLEGQGARVIMVAGPETIPAQIGQYLRDNNLPAKLRMGDDKFLDALPWNSEPNLAVERGPADGNDTVGLTHALTAAAETGTLYMASGPNNPVTLNYLPETHIVVLEAKDISGSYEAAWEHVRTVFGPRTMPRTINMISGPSRTADIGGTVVQGAHGPRNMCVFIVGTDDA
jgi:L-lactate dehydrogenase complex protein LldG